MAEQHKGKEEEGAWPRPHSSPGSVRMEPSPPLCPQPELASRAPHGMAILSRVDTGQS